MVSPVGCMSAAPLLGTGGLSSAQASVRAHLGLQPAGRRSLRQRFPDVLGHIGPAPGRRARQHLPCGGAHQHQIHIIM